MAKHNWLAGKKIAPAPIAPGISARELIDSAFLAYNGGRLREVCRLFSEKMLGPEVTVGLSVSGALTPAGLGCSCMIPLIEAGFVDWIVSTGANLYHDTHFALGMDLHQGSPFVDDIKLRKDEIIRIYDVLFHYNVLLDTDKFYRELIMTEPFQKTMGTAEFHYLTGKFLDARNQLLSGVPPATGHRTPTTSLLVAAYRAAVPVYTSSPGDSSVGMNVAAVALQGSKCQYDPNVDVNETASIVYEATRTGKSAILILGGGSPKNFVLQTEPHIQEILGIPDSGHTYFVQVTDARPDTGGLSGATPAEAVSWGKVDPNHLPDAVVCYTDSTVALPLLTAYALDAHAPRPLRRLYDRREELMDNLRTAANQE